MRQGSADLRVGEHIHRMEHGTGVSQRLGGAAGKTAHREFRRAFHEKHDGMLGQHHPDLFVDVHSSAFNLYNTGRPVLYQSPIGCRPSRRPFLPQPPLRSLIMAIELPPLPYEKNALEPHISAETLEFHYGKHHQAYVTNLN